MYSRPLKLVRGKLCRWYCMYRHSTATITATSPSLLLAVMLLMKLNTIVLAVSSKHGNDKSCKTKGDS